MIFLAACSSTPKAPPPPKPVINSITIISPLKPSKYVLEDTSAVGSFFAAAFPLGAVGAVISAQRQSRSDAFNSAINAHETSIDKELTESVQKELEKLGFKVAVMQNLPRSERWPDYFEYDKLQNESDALLHLTFYEIGLASPGTSGRYIPKLSVKGSVILKGDRRSYLNEYVYYGVQAEQGDREMSVARHPEKSFESLELAITNIAGLSNTFKLAIPAVARRMAEQLHDSVK
jgi:hypothetical protein